MLAGHQTSHNSGVAHAGIYYVPGSLKARLCRRGIDLLRTFCDEHALAWDACGKLVIATETREVEPLRRLAQRAMRTGCRTCGGWMLPSCARSSHTPAASPRCTRRRPRSSTFRRWRLHSGRELRAHGGEVRTGAEVKTVRAGRNGPQAWLSDGEAVDGDCVIVCAGLQADRLAHASGDPPPHGSFRSVASTGSCGPSAASWCADSSTRFRTRRCRSSACT